MKNLSGASHKIMNVKWLCDCFTYVPYNDILINSPRFAVTLKLLSHLFLTNGTVLLHWADEIRVRSEKEIEAHHRFLR